MVSRRFVGNDLVDLSDTDTPYKVDDIRYCQRIFNQDERLQIADATDPHITLWTFWALKEAAYKALKQYDNKIIFIPKQLYILVNKSLVCYKDMAMQYHIEHMPNQYIHVIVQLNRPAYNKQENWWPALLVIDTIENIKLHMKGINALDKYTHLYLSDFFIKKNIALLFGELVNDMLIKRVARIPQLFWKEPKGTDLVSSSISFSLSHHGIYISFVILLNLSGTHTTVGELAIGSGQKDHTSL